MLAIGAGLFEATAVTLWPSPWKMIQPLIPIVIFLLLLERDWMAFWILLLGGLCLDLFSFGDPMLHIIRFQVIFLVLWLLARRVITNRSIYAALGLALVARLLDGLTLEVLSVVRVFFHLPSFSVVWSMYPRIFVWDILMLGITFGIFSRLTRRLSVFIRSPQTYERS